MRSDAIQDEGDMALQALLSSTPTGELSPGLREQARRLASRHFGAGGELPTGLLPEGALVGTYRVERILGMGGQAVVYLGRHVRLQSRLVAIKVPHGTETYRMLREADVMARLDHPGVVKIVDLDAEHDPPYLVLDYCVGGSLADRIESEGPLPESEVLAITRELLEALRFAHLREVIHRDLKPENVLFDASGLPRIGDFGLGKIVAEQISLSLSQASRTGVAGTPLYMAPEQERPSAPVDARADLFALGKLIYHMLTAEPPRTLRPVEHLRSDLRHPWSDLIFALTETFPDARPADADAVLARIEAWGGAVAAAPAAASVAGVADVVAEASPSPTLVASSELPAGEARSPHQEWHERFQRLFDRVFSNLGYSLAFLFAAGGLFALITGSEAGVVPLVFSAGIALVSSLQASEAERRAHKAQELAVHATLALDRRREERDLLRTPARSPGALLAGLLASFTFAISFFTAMGGTIALVLGEDEGGIVALIVSGFFLVATLILLGIRQHLLRRAAFQEQGRFGPIRFEPPAPPAGGAGPVAAQPTVLEAPPLQRPTGQDPLPRA